jgi:CDGSH-type Zn-finger protein
MSDERTYVRVTVSESGPISIRGPITLLDQDGNEYDVSDRKRVVLCRCGASSHKPFCDGSHTRSRPRSARRRSRTRRLRRETTGNGAERLRTTPLRHANSAVRQRTHIPL